MEDDIKTIFAVFFHLIMVLCDGLSANHAKFASYIASLKFRYLGVKFDDLISNHVIYKKASLLHYYQHVLLTAPNPHVLPD